MMTAIEMKSLKIMIKINLRDTERSTNIRKYYGLTDVVKGLEQDEDIGETTSNVKNLTRVKPDGWIKILWSELKKDKRFLRYR